MTSAEISQCVRSGEQVVAAAGSSLWVGVDLSLSEHEALLRA